MSEQIETTLNPFNPLDDMNLDAAQGPDLIMRPIENCARFNLRISIEQLKKAAAAFGMDIPDSVGSMSSRAEKYALCLGPDEWLLLAPQKSADEIITRFAKLAKNNSHSLVDVSHRTIGIEISGSLAQLALSAGCPLDLENMQIGRCTRTILDKAEIILMKLEQQRYRLEVIRSFAPYVWSFLEKSGQDARA
ncbi:MAG: sarcosine oxidase [Devosiaceae bacterium]|nr:sarcosine oxidase [Devosiaceae bacterium]